MLGPMVMALQAKRRTGQHHNALHLKAFTQRKAFIPAPRPVIARKGFGLRGLLRFQMCDRQFHILRAVFGGDQHGIRHGHRHDVFQPDAHQLQAARF